MVGIPTNTIHQAMFNGGFAPVVMCLQYRSDFLPCSQPFRRATESRRCSKRTGNSLGAKGLSGEAAAETTSFVDQCGGNRRLESNQSGCIEDNDG